MNYIKVSEAAKKWGISPRRVRLLCSQNKIEGAIQEGKLYMIPENAEKPADERTKESKILQQSPYSEIFQRINEKQDALEKARPLTSVESQRLKKEFLADFISNSCGFANSTLTLNDISLILDDISISEKSVSEHLDVIGLKDAYHYLEKNINEKNFLSEQTILNTHTFMLLREPFDKGQYRKIPLRKLNSHGQTSEPNQIEKDLKELLRTNEKRKKSMHFIERLVLFHLEFEGIHPFIEGTDNINRLLFNLQLMLEDLPLIQFEQQDKKKYYEAFNTYFTDEDPTPMIELLGGYVEKSLDFYIDMLS